MAIYRWMYANAKIKNDRKDYHIRICDPGLEKYKGILVEISTRLLSADKRRGGIERQRCWFAGYLSPTLYMIAVGGDQKDLIGVESGGYRAQHCVMAYGFSGKDIRVYQKNDDIFEPLKRIMREIQDNGKDVDTDDKGITFQEISGYVDTSGENNESFGFNIIKSTEAIDRSLWTHSLEYPVMTGIISVEDGKKLLRQFPGGIVTVIGDVKIRYVYDEKGGGQDPLPQRMEKKESRERPEKKEKSLEELRREREEAEKKLEKMKAEDRQKKERMKIAMCFFLLLIFCLLVCWIKK